MKIFKDDGNDIIDSRRTFSIFMSGENQRKSRMNITGKKHTHKSTTLSSNALEKPTRKMGILMILDFWLLISECHLPFTSTVHESVEYENTKTSALR